MTVLASVDWAEVRKHYDLRVATHETLRALHGVGASTDFARLLLGISDPTGNYSAAEHALGPRILASNGGETNKRLHSLTAEFLKLKSARVVPDLIRNAGITYLSIGVGSEASCMMNPTVCWVANTRSIWTHLVIKHADDIKRADEELTLYRDAQSSEMAYPTWKAIHAELGVSMTRIAEDGARQARVAGVSCGDLKYLWADAIASHLYASHHDRSDYGRWGR